MKMFSVFWVTAIGSKCDRGAGATADLWRVFMTHLSGGKKMGSVENMCFKCQCDNTVLDAPGYLGLH